jgi:acetate kinase
LALARLMRVLVVNAGSSSLKVSLVGPGDEVLAEPAEGEDAAAFAARAGPVDAVGHRVVHGGPRHRSAVVVDEAVRHDLEALVALAPLHQPAALRGIDALAEALPGVPAVACFDTAFHATLPPAAATYALPAPWAARWGLRRYGFHGLAHAWAARRGPELVGRAPEAVRAVLCHLGSGASCCAVRDGVSVDTTMGFTPLEGLVMATRSGDVDPGLVLWLLRHTPLDAAAVQEGLEEHAGLAGLAGGDGDARAVVAAAAAGDEAARLALDVWAHRLAAAVAAMATSCGGLDLLVFSGGVGEHQPSLRARAAERLAWLGVALDPAANEAASGDAVVSAAGSAVPVAVVTARGDLQIAAEVRALLDGG